MKSNAVQWAKQVAEAFKKELPAEYIQMWKEDKDYVYPFLKPVERSFGIGVISAKKATEIENKTIDIYNQFYTQLIREQL